MTAAPDVMRDRKRTRLCGNGIYHERKRIARSSSSTRQWARVPAPSSAHRYYHFWQINSNVLLTNKVEVVRQEQLTIFNELPTHFHFFSFSFVFLASLIQPIHYINLINSSRFFSFVFRLIRDANASAHTSDAIEWLEIDQLTFFLHSLVLIVRLKLGQFDEKWNWFLMLFWLLRRAYEKIDRLKWMHREMNARNRWSTRANCTSFSFSIA